MKPLPLIFWIVAPVGAMAAGWFVGRTDETFPAGAERDQPKAGIREPAIAAGSSANPPAPTSVTSASADQQGSDASSIRAIMAMTPEELESSIDNLANAVQTPENVRQLAFLWRRFGELDGFRALEKAESFPITVRRKGAVNSVLRGIAQVDPETAWNLGLQRDSVYPVGQVLVENGRIEFLIPKLIELPEGTAKTNLTSRISDKLVRLYPEAMEPILTGLAPGESRYQFVQSFVTDWARSDPVAAIEWTRTLDPLERTSASEFAMRTWAMRSPEALTDWLVSQPGTFELDDSLRFAASMIVRRTPDLAIKMSDHMTEPTIQQEMRIMAISLTADQDPPRAIALIEGLNDPEIRTRYLPGIVNRWRTIDPEAVENYISTSPNLSDAERTHLRQLSGRPPPTFRLSR